MEFIIHNLSLNPQEIGWVEFDPIAKKTQPNLFGSNWVIGLFDPSNTPKPKKFNSIIKISYTLEKYL